MRGDLEFLVLGPVELWSGGRQHDLGAARERCVLAVLLLTLGTTVPAGTLIDRLWDTRPPPKARESLSAYIARLRGSLRRAVGDSVGLAAQAGGYVLDVDRETVDVYRFRRLARQASGLTAGGDYDHATTVLREADGLWRGQALAGIDGDWAARVRAGLEEERRAAIAARVECDLELGHHADLIGELSHLLASYPLDETLIAYQMTALYRSGRPGDALGLYRQTRSRLAGELGTEPGATLSELHQRILRGDPQLAVRAADPGTGRVPAPDTLAPPTSAMTRTLTGNPVALPLPEPATDRVSPAPGQLAMAGADAVPRQLPATVACFTGREGELAALGRLLYQAGGNPPGAVVISAIGGMAGVGKSALAVHWAHQVAERFPDGQLYVNLRGFDPTDAPAAPAGAIRGFLDALGAAPERIPPSLDAQAGLFRSLLAGKKMLIVLDNARDEQQVRPLLPAGSGCLVVVTSRRQLAGLAATDGARLLTLDLPSHAEARQMLTLRVGAERAAAEPDAVDQIAGLCARLPLALAVAAARAHARPRLSLAALAAELSDIAGRLDALDAGDPAASVRAVFSWSYQQLSPEAARMFRLLGLHPGPDITVPAAASLTATARPASGQALQELTAANLLTEHLPGRYAFHDLLRAYAAELAQAVDDQQACKAATYRMLDHYLHTAHAAAVLLQPSREAVPLAPPQPGVAPELLADHQEAMDWFEAEDSVLLACCMRWAG